MAASLKKLQEQEKQQNEEFHKRVEKEESDFLQDRGRSRKTRSKLEEHIT